MHHQARDRKILSQIEEINSQEEDSDQEVDPQTLFDASFRERMSTSPRRGNNISADEDSSLTQSVRFTVSGDLKYIADACGWEIKFETKDCYYFKSGLTSKLDEGFGDIGGQIADIEHEILLQIESEVLRKFI